MGLFFNKTDNLEAIIYSGLAKSATPLVASGAIKSVNDTVEHLRTQSTREGMEESLISMQYAVGFSKLLNAHLLALLAECIITNTKLSNRTKDELYEYVITEVNRKYSRAKIIEHGNGCFGNSTTLENGLAIAIRWLYRETMYFAILADTISNINNNYTKYDIDKIYSAGESTIPYFGTATIQLADIMLKMAFDDK